MVVLYEHNSRTKLILNIIIKVKAILLFFFKVMGFEASFYLLDSGNDFFFNEQ